MNKRRHRGPEMNRSYILDKQSEDNNVPAPIDERIPQSAEHPEDPTGENSDQPRRVPVTRTIDNEKVTKPVITEFLSRIRDEDQHTDKTPTVSYFSPTEAAPVITEVLIPPSESIAFTKPLIEEIVENEESAVSVSDSNNKRESIPNKLSPETPVVEEEPTVAENDTATITKKKKKFEKLGSKWKEWKAVHFIRPRFLRLDSIFL
ncbi:Uncharacterized protein APZ42_003507 [Daphnia magna]|uniref:Uncharacterized protein n=1 Tax=Daphnia magna TaxID=35525 RepID=A0A164HI42_9CRUS|nr:Uncharacterized protein APZ42_003507 [Daphnia magna]